MALKVNKLDERSAEKIYQDARALIPVYAPEWTDYNEGDPGITLLQLFAWLTESMLYQMNRVPDRMYQKFLQLLDLDLAPAEPATVHLTFTPAAGVAEIPILSERTRVALQSAEGEDVFFETTKGLDVIPMDLAHVLVYDGVDFETRTPSNEEGRTPWRPFGWTAQRGSALYLGFIPPSGPARPPRLFPQTMRFRVFRLNENAATPPERSESTKKKVPTAPVKLVWEYRPRGSKRWQALTTVNDESVAFTREGYIDVEGPADGDAFPIKDVVDPHVWLRCRLVDGTYPAGTIPEIAFIRPNVVEAENLSTVQNEILGESDGFPDQTFALRRRPVRRETLALRVRQPDDSDDGEVWERVDDFLASDRTSNHFTLSPITGEICFGNGERGRIPPAGSEIVAVEYRYGGGLAGNVRAPGDGTLLASAGGIASVRYERSAVGGRDEESLDDLKDRAPGVLRSRNRAVSEDDYTELAKRAGGVARARAFALRHPDHPDVEVPGAVTVIIVPDHDDVPPRPSSDLKQSVARFLHPYRLLTTELFVDGPCYRPVTVQATVRADPYASPGEVEKAVRDALQSFLDPKKWELGGDLNPTAFYNEILKVSSVRAVERLVVWVDKQRLERLDEAMCLRWNELVYGEDHVIRVLPYEDR